LDPHQRIIAAITSTIIYASIVTSRSQKSLSGILHCPDKVALLYKMMLESFFYC